LDSYSSIACPQLWSGEELTQHEADFYKIKYSYKISYKRLQTKLSLSADFLKLSGDFRLSVGDLNQ
jgi:hypothetical protein